jgi:tetratricopeptide (TPR) repeat protein
MDPKCERGWSNLAQALARCGHLDRALGAAEKIEESATRLSVFADVAGRLAARNDIGAALEVVKAISPEDPSSAIRLLLSIARIALKAGDSQASSLAMDAATAISEISDDEARAGLVKEAAAVAAEIGTPSLVGKVAESLNTNVDSNACSLLAGALAERGKFELSLQLAGDITDLNIKAYCQQFICGSLISAGRLSEARALAQTIAEPAPKACATGEVAASLAAEAPTEAETLFSEAFSGWKNLEDPGQREIVGHTLAYLYAQKGRIDEASQIIELMSPEGFRPLTMSMVAAATPIKHPLRQGLLEKAYRSAMAIGVEGSFGGSYIVHNVATAMAQAGDRRALEVLHHVMEVDRKLGIVPREVGDALEHYSKEIRGLMWTFLNSGHVEHAADAAQLDSEAMLDLIKSLLAKGNIEEADRLAESITRSDDRDEIRSLRAATLMNQGRAADALASLGWCALPAYLHRLARWCADEQLQVPVAALEKALSVAGWNHSYWRGVHSTVFQSTPNQERSA